MDRDKIVPGKVYRLTRDVKNPKPDRRYRDNWKLEETWKAGWVFYTRSWDERGWEHNGITVPGFTITSLYTGRWSSQDMVVLRSNGRGSEDWDAPDSLIEALEEIATPSLHEALKAADRERWLDDAVELLIKDGVLTVAQVLEAAERAYNAPEEGGGE